MQREKEAQEGNSSRAPRQQEFRRAKFTLATFSILKIPLEAKVCTRLNTLLLFLRERAACISSENICKMSSSRNIQMN